MIDNIKDIDLILKNGQDCIIVDKNRIAQQVNDILENYDKYLPVKKNGFDLSKNFTYDKWIRKIVIEIGKHFFNGECYSKLYGIDEKDNSKLLNHWIEFGVDKKQICYNFNIPETFNAKKYISEKLVKNDRNICDSKNAYLHWFMNGKNDNYKNNINKVTDNIKFGMRNEQLIELNHIFNKIYLYSKIDSGLNKLREFSLQNPNIPINEALDHYIKSAT